MKRSDINAIVSAADRFIAGFGFALPPFAGWTPAQFGDEAPNARRLVDARLGWDVTDYGQGRFDELGLVLFTLRNGRIDELQAGRGMVYAEKLLISRVGQLSPMHRHIVKTEDIINRGGGALAVELFALAPDGGLDRAAQVQVLSDGKWCTLPAGGVLRLAPGQSVTLTPAHWHAFWAEGADVLIGEVSTVNDDETDNIFADPLPRFCDIDEDEPPARLLVSDYARFLG
ncbi:D-lyxose ketol-isomerase [Rhodovulum iodosum]|uniref:D-lyxose ketol-isomerase n=1 Tax=Rhodovulum iodosum TaxID=68291 RepID=A0ABV3XRH9_9RHOB|nr:D-lyxose/D-mannose family sugar isomerase [Rhodovulum robiginosum]RSK31318.1 D-lyxose/D-mannose family sugar isomerase [Rhodovulum robiginosum]